VRHRVQIARWASVTSATLALLDERIVVACTIVALAALAAIFGAMWDGAREEFRAFGTDLSRALLRSTRSQLQALMDADHAQLDVDQAPQEAQERSALTVPGSPLT